MLRKSWLNQPIPLWRLEVFLKELAHLLRSGLPIMTSLALIKAGHKGLFFELCQHLQNRLQQGIALSTAWRQLTQEELSSTLLYTAEQSGTLNESLHQLAAFAKQQRQMRHFIWQALRYPLFLLLLTLGLIITMCQLIIPSFADLYASFNVKLPWFTLMIIQASQTLLHHSHYIITAIAMASGIFLMMRKKYAQHIRKLACMLLPYKNRWHTWQFWSTMTTLLNQGIPFLNAGKICCPLLPTFTQQKLFIYALQQLQHGQKLSVVFCQIRLFRPELQQLFILGENTGQLCSLLSNYIEQEHQALHDSLEQFKTWFEPIIMCLIGGLLGIILLALYLPMVQLGRYV